VKVWIVAPVGYNQYGIEGVYASLEAAKASINFYEWEQDKDGDWITKGASAVSECGYAIYQDEVRS
jgi:hypothetical protein